MLRDPDKPWPEVFTFGAPEEHHTKEHFLAVVAPAQKRTAQVVFPGAIFCDGVYSTRDGYHVLTCTLKGKTDGQ